MAYDTQNIRNVVLLGHSGCGKTTFAETMLFESGAISRRGTIEDRSTISDYTNIEQERGNSIFSTLMHVGWKDSKINIIDTPGFDDFVGEVISSLKVADLGVMLLNAKSGVEVGTELIWEYIEKFQTPAIFVINKLDHEKADFETTLEQARGRFGSKVLPFQFPLEAGEGFNKIVDALRMVMYVFPEEGGRPQKEPIPQNAMQRAQKMHNDLVEAAAENDEKLMELFFDNGTLTEEELAEGLRIALANQEIFPVFCVSSTRNMGSGRIMGFINDIVPSPADRPPAILEDGNILPCNAEGDTTLFIYKTISEPQVGNVSYFKVYSGTLHAGDELENEQTRTIERFNQVFVSEGKKREKTDSLKAGDIGVTTKLKGSTSNQTLNVKGVSRIIDPMVFPPHRIRTAIIPPGKNDMEKLMKALQIIATEDPTVEIELAPHLRQTLLHGQGQLHLDLIKYRIEKVNNISMEFEEPRIPYRETITQMANEAYRHKKQSGGSGQFAEVHMRIEPYVEGMDLPSDLTVRQQEEDALPWGGKLKFLWCIVGGSIDSKYINAIKKGIMQKMEEGPLTGSRCQDIRVAVYDGKMHSVDSNDMAFMIAAQQAFKNAFKKAKPQLLEPIYDVEILCSSDVMGDVMSDLQSRRAMITGMDADGHYQKIKAKVPLAEMYQYSSTLRSLSQGKAKFTRTFASYEPVTPMIQKELVDKANEELIEA